MILLKALATFDQHHETSFLGQRKGSSFFSWDVYHASQGSRRAMWTFGESGGPCQSGASLARGARSNPSRIRAAVGGFPASPRLRGRGWRGFGSRDQPGPLRKPQRSPKSSASSPRPLPLSMVLVLRGELQCARFPDTPQQTSALPRIAIRQARL